MKKFITLTNSFHNTSVRVSSEWGDNQMDAWLNIQIAGQNRPYVSRWRKTYLRVCNALCGIKDCKCGIVR